MFRWWNLLKTPNDWVGKHIAVQEGGLDGAWKLCAPAPISPCPLRLFHLAFPKLRPSCLHAQCLSPVGCSPPGFSIHGILQVRILEWVWFLHPGDLPDPGIDPHLLHWQESPVKTMKCKWSVLYGWALNPVGLMLPLGSWCWNWIVGHPVGIGASENQIVLQHSWEIGPNIQWRHRQVTCPMVCS